MLVQISSAVSNGMVDFLLMLVPVSTGISLLADPASGDHQFGSCAFRANLDGFDIQSPAGMPPLSLQFPGLLAHLDATSW